MGAPNVEAALNMSATEAQKLACEPRKSTIGQRKPASKVSVGLVADGRVTVPLVLHVCSRFYFLVIHNC